MVLGFLPPSPKRRTCYSCYGTWYVNNVSVVAVLSYMAQYSKHYIPSADFIILLLSKRNEAGCRVLPFFFYHFRVLACWTSARSANCCSSVRHWALGQSHKLLCEVKCGSTQSKLQMNGSASLACNGNNRHRIAETKCPCQKMYLLGWYIRLQMQLARRV